MVRKLNMLTHYCDMNDPRGGKFDLPTGSLANVSHIGSSQILGGIEITNVLHVPEFKYNLLSVSKLTRVELLCSLLS